MQIHDHWLKCKVKILWLTVVSRALLQSIFLLQKLFHTLCVQWCNHWKGCRGRDRMVLDTTLCDKVYKWRATGQWFSPGTLVSSINKTDCHNITKILLKVAVNNITTPHPQPLPPPSPCNNWKYIKVNIWIR